MKTNKFDFRITTDQHRPLQNKKAKVVIITKANSESISIEKVKLP